MSHNLIPICTANEIIQANETGKNVYTWNLYTQEWLPIIYTALAIMRKVDPSTLQPGVKIEDVEIVPETSSPEIKVTTLR